MTLEQTKQKIEEMRKEIDNLENRDLTTYKSGCPIRHSIEKLELKATLSTFIQTKLEDDIIFRDYLKEMYFWFDKKSLDVEDKIKELNEEIKYLEEIK